MADETTALWMQAFSWLGLGYVIYRAFFVGNRPRCLIADRRCY
jgi:hypothetical protein